MLIFSKKMTLQMLESQAKKGKDLDFIALKLQKMVDEYDATIEEVQPIVNIIEPPVVNDPVEETPTEEPQV